MMFAGAYIITCAINLIKALFYILGILAFIKYLRNN